MSALNLQTTAGLTLSHKLANRVSGAKWLAGAISLLGCICVKGITSAGCKAAKETLATP